MSSLNIKSETESTNDRNNREESVNDETTTNDKSLPPQPQPDNNTTTSTNSPSRQSIDDGRYCWVCFATDEDDEVAMWVQPCKCRGTTKWVSVKLLTVFSFSIVNVNKIYPVSRYINHVFNDG